MITVFDKKENCCGCSSCKSCCPTKAITMIPDEEGFLYPDINQKKCIDCGLCRKVCPLQNNININEEFEEPIVYAFKHKSNQVRMSSASGGAYTAISDYALHSNYIIYGAEFNQNFLVHHTKKKTVAGRDGLRGSKYIQSDMENVYRKIADQLKHNRGVLFTGTGCQVAGLKKYLEVTGINIEKLILNDIICHGTSSPLLWKKYLNLIQRKSKLKAYTFRAKEIGWRGYHVRTDFECGESKIDTLKNNIFVHLFASDLILRPSCYHCKFCNLNRPTDITIGDFWGVEKSFPQMDDDKGISLVLVNSKKGQELFDKIKESAEIVESNTIDCLQPNLQYPTMMPEQRKQFWKDYHTFGFKYIAKKYAGYSLITRLKRIIKLCLKNFI